MNDSPTTHNNNGSPSGGSPITAATVPVTTTNNTQSIADYLAQLLKDKKQLAAFPNVFIHVERLLDDGKQHHVHAK